MTGEDGADPRAGVAGTVERLSRRLRAAARHGFEYLPERAQRLLVRLFDRDVLLTASSLAFYGLISLLPLLLLSFSVFEAFAGAEQLRRLERAATSPQTGSVGLLARDLMRGASTSWIVVLGTLWPATAYGAGLARALRHMADRDVGPSGAAGRLKGLLFVGVLPALTLLGVPGAFVLRRVPGNGGLQTLVGWVVAAVAVTVAVTVLLILVYHAFAPESLSWRATARGAVATAAGVTVLSLGAITVLGLGVTSDRYGTPAVTGVMLMGVWLFAVNVLLLAGYQGVLDIDRGAARDPDPPSALR